MKNSEVPGIGKIPKHWLLTKLKFFTIKVGSGVTPKGGSDSYVKEGIPLIRSQNVHFDGLHLDDVAYITLDIHKKMSNSKIQENDVLLNITGASIGRTTSVPKNFGDANVNQHVCIVRTNQDLYYGFLTYFLTSSQLQTWISSIQVGASREGLTFEDIKNFIILLPSILEQKQIVEYLDGKTSKINDEISKNQKLIELLKEQKQIVINHAVTKGLDDSVPMKDSGIEWIGKIPKYWNINKIKYSAYVKGRIGWQGLKSGELLDEGPYLITGTDFDNGVINWDTCYHVSPERYALDPHIQIQKGDLLITKDGTIGKLARIDNLPGLATLNSHLLVIRPENNQFDTGFIYWIFSSSQFEYYTNLTQQGTTFNALSQEKIENFTYSFPPLKEQKSIANYINKKTKNIDSLISKIELQIKKLKEFRESLISSAVTGKIQVAEA